MKTKFAFTLLLFFLFFISGVAQTSLRIDNANSSITITGTSNVHDWEMEATGMYAKMIINQDQEKIKSITAAEFSLQAKNINSHNSIMDKKTWEAIKSDKYKVINFNLKQVNNLILNGDQLTGIAEGALNIAGKSNVISIPFSGILDGKKGIRIEGNKEIKLTDYNISPPTAMMGTLKTGETVNVFFNLQFITEDLSTASVSTK